jgi:hypothetical protein
MTAVEPLEVRRDQLAHRATNFKEREYNMRIALQCGVQVEGIAVQTG